jgi:hypothetical protein
MRNQASVRPSAVTRAHRAAATRRTLTVQGWLMMPSMVIRLEGSLWKMLVIKSANSA